MKRAIYFDDRERDLARRVFAVVADRLDTRKIQTSDRFDKMAFRWTCDEVTALSAKFEEPASESKPEEHSDLTPVPWPGRGSAKSEKVQA